MCVCVCVCVCVWVCVNASHTDSTISMALSDLFHSVKCFWDVLPSLSVTFLLPVFVWAFALFQEFSGRKNSLPAPITPQLPSLWVWGKTFYVYFNTHTSTCLTLSGILMLLPLYMSECLVPLPIVWYFIISCNLFNKQTKGLNITWLYCEGGLEAARISSDNRGVVVHKKYVDIYFWGEGVNVRYVFGTAGANFLFL